MDDCEIDATVAAIQANKAAREAAEAMADLMFDAGQELPLAVRRRYWEVLFLRTAEWAGKIGEPHRPVEPAPRCEGAMSDQEAKRFEQEVMPFGKHKGKAVVDVPLDYLFWLDGDEFRRRLPGYLLSDRVQREIQGEPD